MAFFNRKAEPAGIAAVKDLYIDYKRNPRNYLDLESPAYEDEDSVTYRRKALADVIGLECLGKGAYSTAFALDDRKVLKITRREDRGYESFIRFIKSEGRKFSAFPKVYYANEWEGDKVYIIERMETISDDNQADRDFLANYCRDFMDRHNSTIVSRFVNIPEDFNAGLAALKNWYRESRRQSSESIYFDLHNENVMVRPNGQPVITDPFS